MYCPAMFNVVSNMIQIRDEFLSEEDLDLKNLSEEELLDYWDLWLEQAQMTNDADKDVYSHGVFVLMDESLANC